MVDSTVSIVSTIEQRDRQIEADGFHVLRFWDNQVFQETQDVLEEIFRALQLSRPLPSLPPQARRELNTLTFHSAHRTPADAACTIRGEKQT